MFQPKPQFQPSSRAQQTTSDPASTAAAVDQPLSYAQYIVQNKSNVSDVSRRDGPSRLTSKGAALTSLTESESVSSDTGSCKPVQDGTDGNEDTTDHTEGGCQKSDPNQGPKPVGSGSSIIVSPRQVRIYYQTVFFLRQQCTAINILLFSYVYLCLIYV